MSLDIFVDKSSMEENLRDDIYVFFSENVFRG